MEFNGMGLSEITKENQIRQCVQKSCPEAGWHSGVREGQGDPQEPAKEPEKGQGAQEGRRPSEEKVSAVLGGGSQDNQELAGREGLYQEHLAESLAHGRCSPLLNAYMAIFHPNLPMMISKACSCSDTWSRLLVRCSFICSFYDLNFIANRNILHDA